MEAPSGAEAFEDAERMSKKQPSMVIWPASTASLIHGNVIRLLNDGRHRTSVLAECPGRRFRRHCIARCRAGSHAHPLPTKSELDRRAVQQRFDAAAHGVAQHDDARTGGVRTANSMAELTPCGLSSGA